MTQGMVEGVAKAIDEGARAGYFTTGGDGMTMPIYLARAAILAMREPSEAMCKAGGGLGGAEFVEHPCATEAEQDEHDAHGARTCWQAMIDAALTEQRHTEGGE